MMRVDPELQKHISCLKVYPFSGSGNYTKRSGTAGWRSYRDKRKMHEYFRSLPVEKGAWILIRKRQNANWYPALVLEANENKKPKRVLYYGDKHVYQRNGGIEGNPRGEYRIEELMRYKTATYAVLPDYIDLSEVNRYLGDNFSGWNDLRFAVTTLLEIGRIDTVWWQIEDRSTIPVLKKRRMKLRDFGNSKSADRRSKTLDSRRLCR